MAKLNAQKRTPRGFRARRRTLRLQAGFSTALLGIFLILLNLIAARLPLAWDVSTTGGKIAPLTRELIGGLEAQVRIDCVLEGDHPLKGALQVLLRDYRRAAVEAGTEDKLRVRFIDPRRDVRAVASLRDSMGGENQGVVLRYGNETRRVPIEALLSRSLSLEDERAKWVWESFRGDAVIGAELTRLVEGRLRVVYNIEGHGERDFNDYDPGEGYSDAARILRRFGYEIRSLRWADPVRVPEDAAVVVIAGPERGFSPVETEALRRFLDRGGRMLVLLDPGRRAGLDPLLEEWGVTPLPAIAMGQTLTGQELVIGEFGDHPVVSGLQELMIVLTRPAALEIAGPPGAGGVGNGAGLDQPSVTVLASTGEQGWISHDLESFSPGFVPGRDRQGNFAVAAAMEKGGGVDRTHVPVARMVVLGDSGFASNRLLSGGTGANRDLMLGIFSWLTESRIALSAPEDHTLRVSMSPSKWRRVLLFSSLVWPLCWVVSGVIVVRVRRRSSK